MDGDCSRMCIVSAKSILQLAEQEQLFGFLQIVRSAGLEDTFENFGEYTVFAPSESAMYGESLKWHVYKTAETYNQETFHIFRSCLLKRFLHTYIRKL